MPPAHDSTAQLKIQAVLKNWNVTGYITAKDVVLEWIAKQLPGQTLKSLAQALHMFVEGGGVVDQVPERRPEWSAWPFHYDFRLTLGERNVYVETILQDDDPVDPTLHIVSIHDV